MYFNAGSPDEVARGLNRTGRISVKVTPAHAGGSRCGVLATRAPGACRVDLLPALMLRKSDQYAPPSKVQFSLPSMYMVLAFQENSVHITTMPKLFCV